jgi:hypothetical protein
MDKSNRRSFLTSKATRVAQLPALGAISGAVALEDEGTSRRAFLQGTAGAAAGAAVIIATPKVAAVALEHPSSGVAPEAKPVAISRSGSAPREPITAYVRDAERGEVTVLSGQQETTYRDPALVKRMLDAAR